MVQVAGGNRGSLLSIATFESRYREGDRGTLEIRMRSIPPGLTSSLGAIISRTPGLSRVTVSQDGGFRGGTVFINWTKTLGPLILIVAAIGAVIGGALLFLVLSWALFREPIGDIAAALPDIVPDISAAVQATAKSAAVGGVAVAAVVVVFLFLRARQSG